MNRKIILRVLLMLIIANSFIIIPSRAEPALNSGLLLGLRRDAGNDCYDYVCSYRTLWITVDDNRIRVREGKGIYTYYGKTLWRIENRIYDNQLPSQYFDRAYVRIEYPVAYPASEGDFIADVVHYAQSLTGESGGWESVYESTRLGFVGRNHVGLQRNNAYNSGGTYRPEFADCFVRKIAKLNRSFIIRKGEEFETAGDENLSIKTLFGKAVEPYLRKVRAMPVEVEPIGNDPKAINITDEYGWTLFRKKGSWQLKLAQKRRFTNLSTVMEDYDLQELPLEIPGDLVSENRPGLSWAEIRKAAPDAVDYVSFPYRDLLVVFTPSKILIYRGKDLSHPEAVDLHKDEFLIMAEWAPVDDAERWDRELKAETKPWVTLLPVR